MREAHLEIWLNRGTGRKKLVPPVLWETWLSPFASTQEVVSASQLDWQSLQVRTEPGLGCSRYSSRPVIAFFNSLYLRLCSARTSLKLHVCLSQQLACLILQHL